jgi:hypothetical protein
MHPELRISTVQLEDVLTGEPSVGAPWRLRQSAVASARVRKTLGVKVSCPGHVPALIAKFESTATPVPLECHPEVVRPDGHAELPR